MNDPLHLWMVYFDEQSPPEMIEEVLKMDTMIKMADDKMAMIMRDPALLHAYDMFELSRIDYKLGMQGARQDGEQKKAMETLNLIEAGCSLEDIRERLKSDITSMNRKPNST